MLAVEERHLIMNNLFIKGIRLKRSEVESFENYPFNIPVIRDMTEIQFGKPVTFIVGENGSQFIIVTHSPILLSYYDAVILNADDMLRPIDFKDTEIYTIYSRFLSCPEKMQKYLFDD